MISIRLLLCVFGIYACFLTWGVTQERVTTTLYDGKKFKYYIFLNLVQSMCASIVAYLYLLFRGKKLDEFNLPLFKNYVWLSLLSTIASPFGYASLKHIDYPTMILGKSCKLVPVMLMNFIIYRKTFKPYKYVVVAMITAGVSAFMLLHTQEGHEKKRKGENSLLGLLLLSINLLIDGATNSTQDQMFQKYKSLSGSSMMAVMNGFASLYMFTYLYLGPYLPFNLATQEWNQALEFVAEHPAIIKDILLFGLCGALGQCFIFDTLENFGSLLLVTVTVTRKMFSILLSAFWFNHQFSFGQWLSVGTVFAGIILETYMKQLEKKQYKSSSSNSTQAIDNPKSDTKKVSSLNNLKSLKKSKKLN